MARTTNSTATPSTFAELLAMAQASTAPTKTMKGAKVAQLESGETVVIAADSFKGDTGQMVYGVRITGLGGKPKFFTATQFARLFDDAVQVAASEFIQGE